MKKLVVLCLCVFLALCCGCGLAIAETPEAAAPAIDLTALINAVIALLGGLVTYRLIPWLKARTSATQQEILGAAIRTAVYAAEQLYKTNVITDRLDYAENWLREHDYTVSRAEIEAAVKQMQEAALTVSETFNIASEARGGRSRWIKRSLLKAWWRWA